MTMFRITPHMDILYLNAFSISKCIFMSQFSYCTLVWMCRKRSKYPNINRLHERYLRTIYCDKNSTFGELLDKYGSVTIHDQNLQLLVSEMFKSYKK